jgi:hypothetical protein
MRFALPAHKKTRLSLFHYSTAFYTVRNSSYCRPDALTLPDGNSQAPQ